jgi:hypothetical protein
VLKKAARAARRDRLGQGASGLRRYERTGARIVGETMGSRGRLLPVMRIEL